MNKSFSIPETPTCRFVYQRDGTVYSGILNPTPSNTIELQTRLMARNVPIGQVERLEPIHPLKSIEHPDPASNRLDRYLKASRN